MYLKEKINIEKWPIFSQIPNYFIQMMRFHLNFKNKSSKAGHSFLNFQLFNKNDAHSLS